MGTGKRIFIIGFNVAHPNAKAYWEITGRREQYSTPEEALAVLQREVDARNKG